MDQKLKNKIGQMIIAGFPSDHVDDQARRLVADFHVGNFALFARNLVSVEQICSMCTDLHQLAWENNGLAAFMACDQEGGVVSRVRAGAALFPGTMATAASPSSDARQMGDHCGQVLSSLGLMSNFGPVLDVNMDPMNPIIGTRSYSDDPKTVIQHGIPMLLGMMEGGMMGAVKHFPGHGNVSGDSHLELPRNTTPLEELLRTEWAPFQKAFDAGADALMTCHVLYEKVDPVYPATLSKIIMTDILRGVMGFQGIAISDCMAMQAIQKSYGIGPGAVLAIKAGCDILCFSHTYESVAMGVEAIYRAVESRDIPAERIEESYLRIVSMKKKYGLLTPPVIDVARAQKLMADQDIIARNFQTSVDSITMLHDDGGLQILKNAKHPRFFSPASIAVTGAEDKEMAPTLVGKLAVERFGGDSVEIPMDGVTDAVLDAIGDDSYDVAVLALYNARFRAGQRAILRALEEQERPLIVLLMGAPYDLLLIKNAKCIITAYEYTWFAANALLTAIEKGSFKGKLPVKLPEELKLADAK